MALIDEIPKIIKFIDSEAARVREAKDKLNIYEGELLPYVERALRDELNPQAYERAKKRIAPINFLPKVVNKLSTLYSGTVTRELSNENEVDREIMDYYVNQLKLDESGLSSNQQLNLNKYTAWEIYINRNNEPKLRILPAHQFLVYSNDMEDPTTPTVFIKILGSYNKHTGEFDESTGIEITRQVVVYKLYTDDEIIVVDSEMELRPEFMVENPEAINPYGVIPFIYIRKAKYNLLPLEDTSDIPMITLIPLLLTDLNYATQFMSHSIIYSIDAEIQNLSGNPDSIWMIKSDTQADGETNAKAELGTIKPEVDIDKVITLIQTQLALWLDSKDIKAQAVGNLEASNLASGISKMIDEGDTTQAVKLQIPIFKHAESELFRKLSYIHNVWVDQGLLVDTQVNRRLIEELDVTTSFEEPQVVTNEKDRIETIKTKEDAGYTSYKRAVQEANPDLDDEQIEELIEEIQEENKDKRTFTLIQENEEVTNGRNQEDEENSIQEEQIDTEENGGEQAE